MFNRVKTHDLICTITSSVNWNIGTIETLFATNLPKTRLVIIQYPQWKVNATSVNPASNRQCSSYKRRCGMNEKLFSQYKRLRVWNGLTKSR